MPQTHRFLRARECTHPRWPPCYVGLADFITARLRNAIDERKTFINVFTTGDMERAKIPATLATDKELVDTIRGRFGDQRWMVVANTLHLEQLYVSEDLRAEIQQHPACRIDGDPVEWRFRDGTQQLSFGPEAFG